ncbi:MAG: 6,7-dimethyl-8-ribityllumazine synthase [Planctomycetota bacterium]|jgi:6,7-dimethyl-8-ribityllumazine synthase
MARDEAKNAPLTLPPRTRVGLIVSTYHRHVTGGMADSARATLAAAGLDLEADLMAFDAPGAYEIPLLAMALAERKDIDAVLGFGLILKGETEHDRHIAGAVAQGLMDVGLKTVKPVLFGVLTCNTLEQAERRARTRDEGGLDKGHEVAKAAIETLITLRRIAATS